MLRISYPSTYGPQDISGISTVRNFFVEILKRNRSDPLSAEGDFQAVNLSCRLLLLFSLCLHFAAALSFYLP
jgi:hypothetical protein